MPPEAVIDILDDILAPFVLEIDVDVRWLVARIRNEPLEKEVGTGRVDFGDAERITDCGIRRRATPLMQDFLLARETDDVLHGEKEGRVVVPLDQHKLMLDLLHDSGRRAIRP